MRLAALVLTLLAGLLVPVAAHAAPGKGSPNSPLLPPEIARNIHSAPESTNYAAVTDYPAELRALTHVLDNYTNADDAEVHAGMIMLYQGHGHPEFLAAVRAQPEILRALRRFVVRHLGFF